MSCPDLATKLREEIESSRNEEEKVGALAGFVWFGQFRQYPDETIMQVMMSTKEITLVEILSAIMLYVTGPFCPGKPDEIARRLCRCLPLS
ncbi:MAG: hypothetical protein WC725_00515 [Patescibacteria group bacterium]|jgi:hypothetical protein